MTISFAAKHVRYCGAQDTFYVGNLKGVGRVYQQTFIDTYTKVAAARTIVLNHQIPTIELELRRAVVRRLVFPKRKA